WSVAPPWSVSLPAQVAAVAALQDDRYYAMRIRETHQLRAELTEALSSLDVIPGMANFLLCHLPPDAPAVATVASRCRERGLFIRDASTMGAILGDRAIRIAVKDRETNQRMVEILTGAADADRCPR